MENSDFNRMTGAAPMSPRDAGLLPPLTLAFLGDTVYDLYVRRMLIATTDVSPHEMHLMASRLVCAAGQAKAFRLVEAGLTEAELAVFKRGRNAHSGTVPKNASVGDYHVASGLEALVGYLYLSGQQDRLDALMEQAVEPPQPKPSSGSGNGKKPV